MVINNSMELNMILLYLVILSGQQYKVPYIKRRPQYNLPISNLLHITGSIQSHTVTKMAWCKSVWKSNHWLHSVMSHSVYRSLNKYLSHVRWVRYYCINRNTEDFHLCLVCIHQYWKYIVMWPFSCKSHEADVFLRPNAQ